jgi:hypothetical protein
VALSIITLIIIKSQSSTTATILNGYLPEMHHMCDTCLALATKTANIKKGVEDKEKVMRQIPPSWARNEWKSRCRRNVEMFYCTSGAHVFAPVFSGVRVTRSLVLCECFVDNCLSFCTFSFGH